MAKAESDHNMPSPKLTPEVVNAAILGFEQQKLRIDAQIAELRAILPGAQAETSSKPEPATGPPRRKMSAAGRKAISQAQRKRWAASKSESVLPAKPKRKLSPEGRAAIIAATKKRWAAQKAGAQPAKTAAKK
jgi:hypothetical protein